MNNKLKPVPIKTSYNVSLSHIIRVIYLLFPRILSFTANILSPINHAFNTI